MNSLMSILAMATMQTSDVAMNSRGNGASTMRADNMNEPNAAILSSGLKPRRNPDVPWGPSSVAILSNASTTSLREPSKV